MILRHTLTVVSLFGGAAFAQTPTTQPVGAVVGRFQIVNVSTAHGNRTEHSARHIMLLDSSTGQTWLLWPTLDSTQLQWFPVNMADRGAELPVATPTTKRSP